MSSIEKMITEIEDYIDNCKTQPLSNTKIIVNRDEITELLTELRLKVPTEIEKYKRIIEKRENILGEAKDTAKQLVDEAKVYTEQLVNEHQIMQQAYAQANAIVVQAQEEAQRMLNQAYEDAENIRLGAIDYTDEMLGTMQSLLENTVETTKIKYDSLISALSKDLEIVANNRKELHPQPEVTEATTTTENEAEEKDENEYDATEDGMIEE